MKIALVSWAGERLLAGCRYFFLVEATQPRDLIVCQSCHIAAQGVRSSFDFLVLTNACDSRHSDLPTFVFFRRWRFC